MTEAGFFPVLVVALGVGGCGFYGRLCGDQAGASKWRRRLSVGLMAIALLLIVGIGLRGASWWPASPWSAGLGGVVLAVLSITVLTAATGLVAARNLVGALVRLCVMLSAAGGLLLIVGEELATAGALWVIAATVYGLTEFVPAAFSTLAAPAEAARWGMRSSASRQARRGEEAGGPCAPPGESPGEGRSVEPLAACVCGVVLCVCLAGTIHRAYTEEAAVTREQAAGRIGPVEGGPALPRPGAWGRFEGSLPQSPGHRAPRSTPSPPRDVHLLHHALLIGSVLFALGTIGLVVRPVLTCSLLSGALLPAAVMLTLSAFRGFHGAGVGGWWVPAVLGTAILHGGIGVLVVRGTTRNGGRGKRPDPCGSAAGYRQQSALASDREWEIGP